jgi:hypothetical protein
MPQDMKPSRFASDLINAVYVDLWFMIIRIVVNKRVHSPDSSEILSSRFFNERKDCNE